MYYLSILILSFLATLSLASPVARRGVCPSNGSGNVNNNFRLLSVSKDDSSVQSPLAIGSNSYPTPNSETWLGVTDSLGVVVAEDFAMRDSGITAYSSDGGVVGVSDNVAENGLLPFIYPFEDVFVDAEIYCELNTSGDDKYPFTLAVNGDSENFYLCQSRTSSEVLVVYNPLDAGSPGVGFDTTSCTDVYIHIIPKSK